MKISFSTLGCPNWTWNEMIAAAVDLGYDGIELRGVGADLFIPQAKIFLPENLPATRASLEKNGLSIPTIATECLLMKDDAAQREKLRSYLDLAAALGASYIRVLGDTNPWPDDSVNEELVFQNLCAALPYAEEKKVTMLIESNGIFADSRVLRAMIERIGSPYVAALWDINHPVRYFAEDPADTWENIGAYVRHVHVKDSVMTGGTMHYKMLGYGDLPIQQAISILKANGYDGFLSREWTKRWNAELEDAGIVFSHFAYAVRKMIKNA